MQLAAYRRAEFVMTDLEGQVALPETDGGLVLHLRATGGYTCRIVNTDDDVFNHFLYTREVYRWGIDRSRDAIGQVIATHRADRGKRQPQLTITESGGHE